EGRRRAARPRQEDQGRGGRGGAGEEPAVVRGHLLELPRRRDRVLPGQGEEDLADGRGEDGALRQARGRQAVRLPGPLPRGGSQGREAGRERGGGDRRGRHPDRQGGGRGLAQRDPDHPPERGPRPGGADPQAQGRPRPGGQADRAGRQATGPGPARRAGNGPATARRCRAVRRHGRRPDAPRRRPEGGQGLDDLPAEPRPRDPLLREEPVGRRRGHRPARAGVADRHPQGDPLGPIPGGAPVSAPTKPETPPKKDDWYTEFLKGLNRVAEETAQSVSKVSDETANLVKKTAEETAQKLKEGTAPNPWVALAGERAAMVQQIK